MGHFCTTAVLYVYIAQDKDLRLPLHEIMSDHINTDIIRYEDNLSRHRHNGMITHSYYVGKIRPKMNKNTGQRIKYTWHSQVFFILEKAPKPPVPLDLGSQAGGI